MVYGLGNLCCNLNFFILQMKDENSSHVLIDETKKINNQLIKNCNKEVNKTFSKAIKLHSCVLILNVTYEG